MKKTGNQKRRVKVARSAASIKQRTDSLSEKQLIELARDFVPARLRPNARVVSVVHPMAAKTDMAGGIDFSAEVAKIVRADLPPDDPSAAAVEFEADTPLGKRSMMVHVRGNKVTSVVTRASR